MNEQELFSKNIEELTQFARVNNNQINLSDVDDMFKEMNLNEKQMEMIYSYLKLNKIKVMKDGEEYERKEWEYKDKAAEDNSYSEENEEDEDASDIFETEEEDVGAISLEDGEAQSKEEKIEMQEEEAVCFDMYMDDMSNIRRLTADEITEYIRKDDDIARNMLIEHYLTDVVEWIRPYAGKGLAYGDLIQEGNIGLMEAIVKIDRELSDIDEINEYLKKHTVRHIKDVIDESESDKLVGDKVVNRINAVNDCAIMLKEDLGRKPTREEVAKLMNIDMDELDDIIKLSGDKLDSIEKNK